MKEWNGQCKCANLTLARIHTHTQINGRQIIICAHCTLSMNIQKPIKWFCSSKTEIFTSTKRFITLTGWMLDVWCCVGYMFLFMLKCTFPNYYFFTYQNIFRWIVSIFFIWLLLFIIIIILSLLSRNFGSHHTDLCPLFHTPQMVIPIIHFLQLIIWCIGLPFSSTSSSHLWLQHFLPSPLPSLSLSCGPEFF